MAKLECTGSAASALVGTLRDHCREVVRRFHTATKPSEHPTRYGDPVMNASRTMQGPSAVCSGDSASTAARRQVSGSQRVTLEPAAITRTEPSGLKADAVIG